jgi:hypothetical protein
LLDEGATNISLIYSDLAAFFLVVLAGAFLAGALRAGALRAGAFAGASDCLFLNILLRLDI